MSFYSEIAPDWTTTLPAPVTDVLGLTEGDEVVFLIEGSAVTLGRAKPLDVAHLRGLGATLSEWETPEDEAAFQHLDH